MINKKGTENAQGNIFQTNDSSKTHKTKALKREKDILKK